MRNIILCRNQGQGEARINNNNKIFVFINSILE